VSRLFCARVFTVRNGLPFVLKSLTSRNIFAKQLRRFFPTNRKIYKSKTSSTSSLRTEYRNNRVFGVPLTIRRGWPSLALLAREGNSSPGYATHNDSHSRGVLRGGAKGAVAPRDLFFYQ